jgi:hypothetical protein
MFGWPPMVAGAAARAGAFAAALAEACPAKTLVPVISSAATAS